MGSEKTGAVKMSNKTISSSLINMMLKQLGADEIVSTPTHIHIVSFRLSEDLTVIYTYNVRNDENIYLQRVEPYPIVKERFETTDEVIRFMTRDISLFRNAYNRPHFQQFLSVCNNMAYLADEFEDLFLKNDLSSEDLDRIDNAMTDIRGKIKNLFEKTSRLDAVSEEKLETRVKKMRGFRSRLHRRKSEKQDIFMEHAEATAMPDGLIKVDPGEIWEVGDTEVEDIYR